MRVERNVSYKMCDSCRVDDMKRVVVTCDVCGKDVCNECKWDIEMGLEAYKTEGRKKRFLVICKRHCINVDDLKDAVKKLLVREFCAQQ